VLVHESTSTPKKVEKPSAKAKVVETPEVTKTATVTIEEIVESEPTSPRKQSPEPQHTTVNLSRRKVKSREESVDNEEEVEVTIERRRESVEIVSETEYIVHQKGPEKQHIETLTTFKSVRQPTREHGKLLFLQTHILYLRFKQT